MTSVERIKDFSNLDSEYDHNKKRLEVDSDWPRTGDLQLIDVSMRYDKKLPPALSSINLNIKSGQKVRLFFA